MADAFGPSRPTSDARLDGPPPLPREASRRAPVGLTPPAGNGPQSELGMDASNPTLQSLMLSKQIETAGQQLAAMHPDAAADIASLLAAFRQIAARALATMSQPPSVGAPNPGMVMPPMPLPPVGAGQAAGMVT